MKKLPAILVILWLMVLTAAQAERVWPTETKGVIFKKLGPPIETVAAPASFIVTPAEVSEMFSPRKFDIMIYADDTHYFVTRYDRKQTLKQAQLFGTSINGKTGAVEKKGLGLNVQRTYEEVKPRISDAGTWGGTVSYTSMLMVSRRPLPGDFQGARFPDGELRHLNELLAKGVVIDDPDPLGSKEGRRHFSSYTLRGKFIYAGEPYVAVEILAITKNSSLVGMRHVVILMTGQQEGRKVVYLENPELVAYILSDAFKQKLLEWNSDKEEKIEPFGQMKLTLLPLDNLVYVDPATAATQHPLVCGKGRDFPDGHEMQFRNLTTGMRGHQCPC